MGPELSTAAADQNFAWICKQHQDLIGSVLVFRTKIIWSGPEFGLVRCGYLNAAYVLHSKGSFFMIINVSLRFSPCYCMKCIGYNMNCIGAYLNWLQNGTNKVCIVTNTLRTVTLTKS